MLPHPRLVMRINSRDTAGQDTLAIRLLQLTFKDRVASVRLLHVAIQCILVLGGVVMATLVSSFSTILIV